MPFDCSKMHHKCQAVCCGVCPIPKTIYESNRNKIVNPPEEEAHQELTDPENGKPMDFITPVTRNLRCPFLNKDLSCNIYEDRPWVCRKFGDESHHMLTCCYQDKNGRERSRQEIRGCSRMCEKKASQTFSKLRMLHSKLN